jgi:hypothetical protein
VPDGVLTVTVHRRGVVAALLGVILAAATDVAYLLLFNSQDSTPPHPGVVPFVVVYLAAMSATALLGVVLIVMGRQAPARAVLAAAAAGHAALGFLAIFSVGPPLIIASGLLAAAAFAQSPEVRRPGGWVPSVVSAVIAVALLVAGLTLTGVFWGS